MPYLHDLQDLHDFIFLSPDARRLTQFGSINHFVDQFTMSLMGREYDNHQSLFMFGNPLSRYINTFV
jgi:hypothetical protein